MLYTYINSKEIGLRYVVAQPYRNVMKKVSHVKSLSFMIIIGALLLGVLISLYLSRHNAKSLKEIFAVLSKVDSKGEGYKDPFDHIQESVFKIMQDNQMLNDTIDQQISFLYSSFFYKLKNGDFASDEELVAYAGFIGLNFTGKAFAACIVQIEQMGKVKLKFNDRAMKELEDGRRKVIGALKESAFARMYCDEEKGDLITVIFILEDESADHFNQSMASYMQSVRNELMRNYEIDIRFSWGDVCLRPTELSDSIRQEARALDYANSNHIQYDIWYPEFIRSYQNVFFPKEWEDRLIELTKCGNGEKIKKLIFELQLKNLKKHTILPETLSLFTRKLYSILMRLTDEVSIDWEDIVPLDEPPESSTLDHCIDTVEYISEAFVSLCKEIDVKKKQQGSSQMDEICKYVDENFMDNNLSLSALAEKFNYSPSARRKTTRLFIPPVQAANR